MIPTKTRYGDRLFHATMVRMDNAQVLLRKIVCATCGSEGEIIDRTATGLPPNVTEKKFVQKGWSVGKNDKHDFCPACVMKEKNERRSRRLPSIKLVSDQGAEIVPNAVPVADAPSPMSLADRRIIFAKLSDVYVDEHSGYQSPWTDKRVSEDLGVPRQWVELIRNENFGPASDNSEIRDMLERVKVAAGDAKSVLEEAKKIRAEGAGLVERINALNRDAASVAQRLDGLLAIADRISASVE